MLSSGTLVVYLLRQGRSLVLKGERVGLVTSHLNELVVHFFITEQVLLEVAPGCVTLGEGVIVLEAVVLIKQLKLISQRSIEPIGTLIKLLLVLIGKELPLS